MGLKDYTQQMRVIRQSDAQIAFLESYAKSMNEMIILIGVMWTTNQDQGRLLNAIGDCVYYASQIAYDYSVFSVNALRWLGQMDMLEELAKTLIRGNSVKVTPHYSNHTEPISSKIRSEVQIELYIMDEYINTIQGYTSRLEEVHAKTAGIAQQIDRLIINKFVPQYSISGINKRIAKLSRLNASVASAYKKIRDLYAQTEAELKQQAEAILLNTDSSGSVSGEIAHNTSTESGSSVSGGVVTPASNVGVEIEADQKQSRTDDELLNYINTRNDSLAHNNDLKHHCTWHTKEKLETVGVVVTSFGNGNTWYQNLKNHVGYDDSNVNVECYDGADVQDNANNFWNKILSGEVKTPIYNLVISYSSNNDPYGHVLMIDAIKDGKVYYSDNWAMTNVNALNGQQEYVQAGDAQVTTIETFRNRYRGRYTQQGVVHFTSK